MKSLIRMFLLLSFLFPSIAISSWCGIFCAEKYKEYAELSEGSYENKQYVGNWVRTGDADYTYKTKIKICHVNNFQTLAASDCNSFDYKDIDKTMYLSAYENNITGDRVFVFRGTKITDIDDLKADYGVIATDEVPELFKTAREVIQNVVSYRPEYKGAILTGHSLGGGLAQFAAASLGMKSYSFNPLGLNSNMMTDAINFSSLRRINQNIPYSDSNHVSIISNNNAGQIDWASGIGKIGFWRLEGLGLLGSKKYMYVGENGWADIHKISNLRYALDYQSNKIGRLSNKRSGKCIDTYGGGVTDWTPLIQYHCTDTSRNEEWILTDGINSEYIINGNNNKCLDISGGSYYNSASAIIYTCHSGNSMRWDLIDVHDEYFLIKNKQSGKCLSVKNNSMNIWADIAQYTCNSSNPSMLWKYE